MLGGGDGMAGQFSCTVLEGRAYVAGPFGLLSFSPDEGWATLPAPPTPGGCPLVAVRQLIQKVASRWALQLDSPAFSDGFAGCWACCTHSRGEPEPLRSPRGAVAPPSRRIAKARALALSTCRHDRFVEAQGAYTKAGQGEQSLRMLETLTHNAVVEHRFPDAAYYLHLLSTERRGQHVRKC